jgi:SWI/SNF-related matrix-associated actin-dependent regulator of chromatin subfamily A member 5
MVVQQGRLKESDKLSKEDVMAVSNYFLFVSIQAEETILTHTHTKFYHFTLWQAVRFGADAVFRSEESSITDLDIDVILERGKAKTKELAEKIQKAEKGDLLDFRLDGGVSAQTFEGVSGVCICNCQAVCIWL